METIMNSSTASEERSDEVDSKIRRGERELESGEMRKREHTLTREILLWQLRIEGIDSAVRGEARYGSGGRGGGEGKNHGPGLRRVEEGSAEKALFQGLVVGRGGERGEGTELEGRRYGLWSGHAHRSSGGVGELARGGQHAQE